MDLFLSLKEKKIQNKELQPLQCCCAGRGGTCSWWKARRGGHEPYKSMKQELCQPGLVSAEMSRCGQTRARWQQHQGCWFGAFCQDLGVCSPSGQQEAELRGSACTALPCPRARGRGRVGEHREGVQGVTSSRSSSSGLALSLPLNLN